MTLHVVAPQAKIAMQWVAREGLSLSRPKVHTDGHDLRALSPAASFVVVLDCDGFKFTLNVEEALSYLAQRGIPVVRLDPETQHGGLAVVPTQPSFEPPTFDNAEEAQAWLDDMSKVVERQNGLRGHTAADAIRAERERRPRTATGLPLP